MTASAGAPRSPSEARAAALADARRFAAARRPADLIRQWATDASLTPSPLDQRTVVAYDAVALDAAAGYEALLLSPVAPLGTNSVVAPTSQDRTLTTTRSTEVVSDPTNVLALEAAARLREAPDARVRLCSVHQTLRPQAVPIPSGHTTHFRLFALADAGRGLPDDAFEVHAIIDQAAVHLRLLDAAAERFGLAVGRATASILADADSNVLADRVADALGRRLPGLELERALLASTYYRGIRVLIRVADAAGAELDLVDIGAFDWAGRLTSDARQRFVASAIGLQLLPLRFAVR
ncbi:hypothetical protein GE115_12325 [Agromyces sp. CFH 90414]|uniref:Uncharacterized protein n=1 Tax=Agromyces agglutinans TaxID=2662258 RepID=A0A6I2FA26_9MICO|nr:hypothetical protein [Agromyces agglutinans]MRG60647.1 hypothetical protein [Agromyces agglutinans]